MVVSVAFRGAIRAMKAAKACLFEHTTALVCKVVEGMDNGVSLWLPRSRETVASLSWTKTTTQVPAFEARREKPTYAATSRQNATVTVSPEVFTLESCFQVAACKVAIVVVTALQNAKRSAFCAGRAYPPPCVLLPLFCGHQSPLPCRFRRCLRSRVCGVGVLAAFSNLFAVFKQDVVVQLPFNAPRAVCCG